MIPTLLSLAVSAAQAEDKTLFAGTVATEQTQTLDTLLEYKAPKGLHLLTEGVVSPQIQTISFGIQSPIVQTPVGNLQANAATDLSLNNWGYTAYLQDQKDDGKVRAGVLQDPDTLGAFVGGSYVHRFFSVDADIWNEGKELNVQGYTAITPGKWFLSLGGNPRQERLTTSVAYLNPHSFGLYADTVVDLAAQEQLGKVFLADKSTIKRPTADFLTHIVNRTEMRAVTTGFILDSWAPFDAYRTEHIGAALHWDNTRESFNLKTMGYARPAKDLFFGLGLRDIYTKATQAQSVGLDLEVYTKVPKTPLETWANTDIDLQTGQANLQLYVGGSWSH